MNDLHAWLSQNGFLTYGIIGAAFGALAMEAQSKRELVSRFVIGAGLSCGITPHLAPLVASLLDYYLESGVGETFREQPAPLVGTLLGLIGFWLIAIPLNLARNSLQRAKDDRVTLLEIYKELKSQQDRRYYPPSPWDPIEPLDDEDDDWPQLS